MRDETACMSQIRTRVRYITSPVLEISLQLVQSLGSQILGIGGIGFLGVSHHAATTTCAAVGLPPLNQ